MKSTFSSIACAVPLALGLLIAPPALAQAQEAHQVVDEVIAQVNDDVITLSRLQSESKRRIEALKKMGWSEQHATDEVTKHRDQLIATLINEQLLLQKGKELDLSEKVEAELNRRLDETTMHQLDPTENELYEQMRITLRTEITIQAVFEQEVDAILFAGFSLADLHSYFETHKDKFRIPETVTLSEIFLSSAGKDDAQVKAKANQLVAQLRAGADFARMATTHSDRDEEGKRLAPTKGGKVGTFELPNLRENIATAIRNIKAGAVSDPLKTNNGYQILRIDERTPARAPVFNQNRAREAMTAERSPKAHEEYLQQLRDEAYIQIAKNYHDAGAPKP